MGQLIKKKSEGNKHTDAKDAPDYNAAILLIKLVPCQ